MTKRLWWSAVVSLVIWQSGCGGGTPTQAPGSGSPGANISVFPGGASVGSPDLTITINGSKKFTFSNGPQKFTQVVWSQASVDTALATTFVSSSQVTAIVPAPLLANALTADVRVEIWDMQVNTLVATSSSVAFPITVPPSPTPSIASISPSTVAAGSPDLTITIDGSNFGRFGHFIWSTAFWTTNGNLHDTGTWLQTTIISRSQLTAVIPAKLLQSPNSVQIVVMNGDVMGMSDGYFGYPRSNSVTFTVTP